MISLNTWFATEERIRHLQAVARNWVGVPFFPHGRTKAGVSCQTFVTIIYQECGFLSPAWRAPEAPMTTGFEPMCETINGQLGGCFVPIEDGHALPGDLLCYRLRRQGHLGVCIAPAQFIHCLRHTGVIISRLDDAAYLNAQARGWRPVTPQE